MIPIIPVTGFFTTERPGGTDLIRTGEIPAGARVIIIMIHRAVVVNISGIPLIIIILRAVVEVVRAEYSPNPNPVRLHLREVPVMVRGD